MSDSKPRRMLRNLCQLPLLLLLVGVSTAQPPEAVPAVVRKIKVAANGGKVRVEVTLTAMVSPTVLMVTGPDRLVLQLPNTEVNAREHRIAVNQNGVTQLRIGLDEADTPVTRIVLDLNGAHPYGLMAAGNTITLTVLPGASDARSLLRASGARTGKLWHRQETGQNSSTPVLMTRSGTGVEQGLTFVSATARPAKDVRTKFKLKYVAEGAAYLNGGRSSGLAAGMTLVVRDGGDPGGKAVAELDVVSVAQNSAITEIRGLKRDLKAGDWAYLSVEDAERLRAEQSLGAGRRESPVSMLTSGDRLDGKERDPGARSPTPEASRIRGRIGLDYSGIRSGGPAPSSSSERGLTVRADMTRIGGTYWNLQGYWRRRLTKNSPAGGDTLRDYLDRTYTMQLYYDNPNSKWVGGVGRLYLPWAASLDTIDGGYLGRRAGHGVTAGIFAGSTPDPASWHYSPDRRIAGSFVNWEGGRYDSFHYTSTAGFALNTLQWRLDRPYFFAENGLSYGSFVYVYHSLIIDSPRGVPGGAGPGAGISRSYLAFHIQPSSRISFDVSHNYFRDVPTAVTQLIATGMVDKLLYQGVNAGVRVEATRHLALYSTIGRSKSTGDRRRSLNQMYGVTWSEIWRTGIRADLRYSKFDSSFARGQYRILSFSRHLGDRIFWDAQIGSRTLESMFSSNRGAMFVDTSFDTNLGSHTFVQSGYTIERGGQLNYDQWYVSLGYRFDVKGPEKKMEPTGPNPF